MTKKVVNVRKSKPYKDKYGNTIIRRAHKRNIETKKQEDLLEQKKKSEEFKKRKERQDRYYSLSGDVPYQ